ncbi:MAG TPA: cytochrome c [Cyclobacteriaceae bacterium]|nr:cytochrome c [Cyclobacteriaceae bacterium]
MKYIVGIALGFLIFACTQQKPNEVQTELSKSAIDSLTDPATGIGLVRDVVLNSPLEQDKVDRGLTIYEKNCKSCHKLDDQRLVGPGWKDVTHRRKPEWILNMITNVDMMLDNDEQAQKLLETCKTRMNVDVLSVADARDVLEFMRQNDGEK